MNLGTYKGERTLSELVGRFYRISGPRASELAREAEAALVEANPELRTMSRVRANAVIVVPPIRGASASDDATPAAAPLIDMIAAIRGDLKELRIALAASAREAVDEAKESLRFAKSSEVVAAAKTDDTLKSRLNATHAEMDRQVRLVETFRSSHAGPLDEIERDLEKLAARLR